MFSSLQVSLPSSASSVSCRWPGCGLTQRLLLYKPVYLARKSAICCWYIYSQSHLKCSHWEMSKSSCVCACVWKMCYHAETTGAAEWQQSLTVVVDIICWAMWPYAGWYPSPVTTQFGIEVTHHQFDIKAWYFIYHALLLVIELVFSLSAATSVGA